MLSIRWGCLDYVFISFDFGCSSFLYFQIILFPVLKFLYLQIILFPVLKRLLLRLVLHIIGLVNLLLLMQLFRGAFVLWQSGSYMSVVWGFLLVS